MRTRHSVEECVWLERQLWYLSPAACLRAKWHQSNGWVPVLQHVKERSWAAIYNIFQPEISHITQWYIRATPFCQRGLILKIQMGFLLFLFSLSTPQLVIVRWIEKLALIKASVEVGSVTQLSYLLSSPLAYNRQTPLLRLSTVSMLSHWSQTRCCCLGWHLGGSRLSRVQHNQKALTDLAQGPHILFELTTQAEQPVYNLQQGQRSSLNLSGWQSDVEQMCWNGGNYVTFFPLSCDYDD